MYIFSEANECMCNGILHPILIYNAVVSQGALQFCHCDVKEQQPQ